MIIDGSASAKTSVAVAGRVARQYRMVNRTRATATAMRAATIATMRRFSESIFADRPDVVGVDASVLGAGVVDAPGTAAGSVPKALEVVEIVGS